MKASPKTACPAADDAARYREVRGRMPALAAGLTAEDLQAQSMPDASPGKWHLGHVSWFFETMLLGRREGYAPVDAELTLILNSYYEALGERVARPERGLMTRPSLDQIMTYRAEVDRRMESLLADGLRDEHERYLFELGLAHEEQHCELFLMDLLHLMSRSPLEPAAYEAEPRQAAAPEAGQGFARVEGGLVEIGAGDAGFAFDNEKPRHQVFVEPFAVSRGLATNGRWLTFIEDGGYERPELWLSDGWATVRAEGWSAPLYWRREADGLWTTMTLAGRRAVDPSEPVRHVSFYEADAFARWAGKRLPSEAEWEVAAQAGLLSDGFGEVWQWTASAYLAYPRFRPTPGTASEYNGKFMSGQQVLRGSSWATPAGHERATYRNFFPPSARWAFSGVRLADEPALAERPLEPVQTQAFREAMIEGLSRPRKATSPKWFYDARGSELFEDITRLEAYYPTRQEAALLERTAPRLAESFGPGAVLVEFGSGASEKTRKVLDAAHDLAAYVAIDISPDALREAKARLETAYPDLVIRTVAGDFLSPLTLPADLPEGRRVGLFPGSTIGNLEPDEAVRFLKGARDLLGPDALFVLGVDLVKDVEVLERAYDDPEGVTAAFNLNLLARANRELKSDFDLAAFRHRAIWNPARSAVEMHLESTRPQTVHVGGRAFGFDAGETIHTESSRKFTEASLRETASAAGWTLERLDVSPDPSVALALLAA
ncbi:ergothioneine biosynthesis protein EgtB [Brevundimonas fluminis]|jgi:dimethylhistidine N-methyltransferase|uniref:ergothioneine biosynthesis protein EgtB n=1 Tax=Brevundimonas fluminis TaxID=2487274 RepID=UPI000F65769B|nr:ergothioneine biosynthesis protein EgtB [Brevundimonas fluminis]